MWCYFLMTSWLVYQPNSQKKKKLHVFELCLKTKKWTNAITIEINPHYAFWGQTCLSDFIFVLNFEDENDKYTTHKLEMWLEIENPKLLWAI